MSETRRNPPNVTIYNEEVRRRRRRRRVLVTGGAGFLGSHICDRLIREGDEVICVDNLFSGSRDNIKDLLSEPTFEFIRHDITFPLYLEVDAIFNMACPASPLHYQYDPVQTTKTSVHGMINMLGLAKRTRSPILQASTSEVYGNPEVHPQVESYWGHVNTIGIRSCYDEGKRCAETLCFDYHRQYGVDVRVVRIFNTYGPRMSEFDGRVMSNFIIQALRGDPITIYGDGNQTRSFCYVDDLVDGILKAMENPDATGPINLGNPCEVTIKNLAEEIVSLTGGRSEIVYKDLPADDPERRCPDISKAREILDWQPKVELRDGIKRTIEYFEKRVRVGQSRG